MKTAHDKLIEMGYKYEQIEDAIYYNDKNSFNYICFSKSKKTYRLGILTEINVELSRVLTQYLEELEK